jgi:hypothetical protein
MNPEKFAPMPSNGDPLTDATPGPARAAVPGERQTATIRYHDHADVKETFADSVTGLVFDGQTLRLEFGVTRLDEIKTNTPITGRRHPACRLVLTLAAAVDLANRMQRTATALAEASVLKPPRSTKQRQVDLTRRVWLADWRAW